MYALSFYVLINRWITLYTECQPCRVERRLDSTRLKKYQHIMYKKRILNLFFIYYMHICGIYF